MKLNKTMKRTQCWPGGGGGGYGGGYGMKLFHLPVVFLIAFATAVHAGNAAQGVPTLDDLAGDWMEVNTIRNFPSVNNFRGALKIHDNLTTFILSAFPPYANGGDSGVLTMNGKLVTATRSRWFPYQVLRRATVEGVELESAIRMPFDPLPHG